MSEKYFSETKGFEDCFIEVSDNWTMREVREMTEGDEKVYYDFFAKKVESMLLRDVDGKEFTNPRELVEDNLLNMDVTLVGFFGSILSLHIRRRKSLGGMNVRPLSLGTDSTTQANKK